MTHSDDDTRRMLARHHGDGHRFAQAMRESFLGRFDESFWSAWEQWVGPILPEKPTLVDMGSGPGLLLKTLAHTYPQARVVGVEVAHYMLEAMGKLPAGIEVVEQDLHEPHLPLGGGTVDAVIASAVLHEMTQPLRLLQEACRVLKPNGRLVVIDWVRAPLKTYLAHEAELRELLDPATSRDRLDDVFTHFAEHNRFTREDLEYLLDLCGLAVLESTSLKQDRFVRIIAAKH